MVTGVSHGQRVDAESVVLPVIAAETVFRYAVAVVAAALLPRSVLGSPALSAIISPGGLLFVHVHNAALLDRPVVLLLTARLLPLISVRSSLAPLIQRIISALPLLILLLRNMLVLLLCIVLLLRPSCVLSAVGLLVILSCGFRVLLLSFSGLILFLRFFLFLFFSCGSWRENAVELQASSENMDAVAIIRTDFHIMFSSKIF
jgi:hypothetical protein